MTDQREPCTEQCSELCEREVGIGYLMHSRNLTERQARNEVGYLAKVRHISTHQMAHQLLNR